MVAGRLKNDGTLVVSGEVSTRTPLVTNGLVAHFPLDGTTAGIANNNLLDYSTWTVGTTQSQSGFSANGDGNSIIHGECPFGSSGPIWRTLNNDADSDADGGWNSGSHAVDSSKLYRFSVWIKRDVAGNGTTYLGAHGYGSTNGVTIQTNSGFTANTNPYFYANSAVFDGWVLMIGHIHPHNDTSYRTHPDTGVWYPSGKLAASAGDFRWHSSSTSANHRSYLYYSTNPDTNQQFAYPRIDLCDGTEPTLNDLLSSEANIHRAVGTRVRYIRDWLNGSTANTGNHWCEISAYNNRSTRVTDGIIASGSTTISSAEHITDGNYS